MQGNNRRVTAPEMVMRASAADPNLTEGMQTIVWTRDLDKVDPHDIETCEDLLDTYFLMVSCTCNEVFFRLSVIWCADSCYKNPIE